MKSRCNGLVLSLSLQVCSSRSVWVASPFPKWLLKGRGVLSPHPHPPPTPTDCFCLFLTEGVGLPQPQGRLCHYRGPVQQRLMATCGQTPSDARKGGHPPDVVRTARSAFMNSSTFRRDGRCRVGPVKGNRTSG